MSMLLLQTVCVYAYLNNVEPARQGEMSSLLNLFRVLGGVSPARFSWPTIHLHAMLIIRLAVRCTLLPDRVVAREGHTRGLWRRGGCRGRPFPGHCAFTAVQGQEHARGFPASDRTLRVTLSGAHVHSHTVLGHGSAKEEVYASNGFLWLQ